MSAPTVLTAASAVELRVQIQLDRTTVYVTMVTGEMEKTVVYPKVSTATWSGQYWFRGVRATLNFRIFRSLVIIRAVKVFLDYSQFVLNLNSISAEIGLDMSRLQTSRDSTGSPKIPEFNYL